jgi:predicted aldo/keto reductase-like oxidoreductase
MSAFCDRQLGRTGLRVSPLGIGGGGRIGSDDLLYAFDQGINYFFFSSDLHHFAYSSSVAALRTLCGQGSSVRDRVVLATVSYVNDPEKLTGVLYDQLKELGVDYIDVFHWGWVTDADSCPALFAAAARAKSDARLATRLLEAAGVESRVREANERLKDRGLVGHVGASFHDRRLACRWVDRLDVVMLRYNIAHRGAERDVFPFLVGDKSRDPGIVVFNAAHEGDRRFDPVPDAYRFALSHPAVDLVLTGVKNRQQIDDAIAAMARGPLSPEECAATF